jgi:hypothetical protein
MKLMPVFEDMLPDVGVRPRRGGGVAVAMSGVRAASALLWLKAIPPVLHAQAIKAFDDGDHVGFLCTASNAEGLSLVYMNCRSLLERGIYEGALLHAFTSTRSNNRAWPRRDLDYLFNLADRDKLRAAGDPLPHPGPYTVFRGVSGCGRARRVRGFSWTAEFRRARWFADRFPDTYDPAVYEVTVSADDVLAYVNESGRHEDEYIVLLPPKVSPRVVPGGLTEATRA